MDSEALYEYKISSLLEDNIVMGLLGTWYYAGCLGFKGKQHVILKQLTDM